MAGSGLGFREGSARIRRCWRQLTAKSRERVERSVSGVCVEAELEKFRVVFRTSVRSQRQKFHSRSNDWNPIAHPKSSGWRRGEGFRVAEPESRALQGAEARPRENAGAAIGVVNPKSFGKWSPETWRGHSRVPETFRSWERLRAGCRTCKAPFCEERKTPSAPLALRGLTGPPRRPSKPPNYLQNVSLCPGGPTASGLRLGHSTDSASTRSVTNPTNKKAHWGNQCAKLL